MNTYDVHDRPPENGPARAQGTSRVLRRTAVILIAVALVAGGFYVGRLFAPKAKDAAHPAVTVTRTVLAKGVSATSPTPSPTASTSSPSSPSASPAPTSSSSGKAASASGSNGTLLGSYDLKFPPGYNTPLGPTIPAQAQFTSNITITDDIGYSVDNCGGGFFCPDNNDKMVGLANGVTPTYKLCKADTVLINGASGSEATAFCVIEADSMVGVVVKSISPDNTYALLQVTVWKSTS